MDNNMKNRLIAHVLWKNSDKQFLFIRRSAIKREKTNVYPLYWDIPGGSVEEGELPAEGAIREVREETGLSVKITGIILKTAK